MTSRSGRQMSRDCTRGSQRKTSRSLARRANLVALASLLVVQVAAAESWETAVSRNGERQIIFRYSKDHDPKVRRAQRHRVIIVWKYQSPNGMPSQEERQ